MNLDELWGRALTDSVLCQTGLAIEFIPGVWGNPCGGRAFQHVRTDDQSTPTVSEIAVSSWACCLRSSQHVLHRFIRPTLECGEI